MRIFKKLIRDKMPDIMKAQGKELIVRRLDDDGEYKEALLRKLIEEIQEMRDAKDDDETKDKLAYLYEIIDAIIDFHGFSKDEILEIKKKSHAERGGFEERLFLEGSN